MEISPHVVIPVHEVSQPSAARRAAQDLAAELSFPEEDRHRAGLVVTELATNLVKHTTAGGELLLRPSTAPGQIEVVAHDRGPGMRDVGRAMEDGHSTSGSPGTGLGAVRRLADDFDIYSQASRGTAVLARIRGRRRPPPQPPVDASGLSVAVSGETACGDAWCLRPHPSGPIAAVVDGLGHGPGAADAARVAITTLAEATFDSLEQALALLHDALRPTRGAAMSLLQLDRRAGVARFAGLGNVMGAICHNSVWRRAVSLNGTLGHQARTFREFSYPWPPGALFVLCSDGLISHWSLDDYPGLVTRQPALVAAVLYRDFSRGRDDATVVVGREAA